MKKVLVTGGNAGIGLALCTQLVGEDGCHVYLCSRNEDKGKAAVAMILEKYPNKGKCELVVMDVGKDESVTAAAKALSSETFYGIVNNAGAGLSHGVSSDVILNVNLMGPKRVCDAFLPLLDKKEGRIVNVSSGAASAYVKGSMGKNPMGKAKSEEKAPLISFDVTWEQILGCVEAEKKAGGGTIGGFAAYGLSKAALTAYTMSLAKAHPKITSSSCSPGFIATAMTKGFGAKLSPEQGTVSLRHCLFGKLGGNGWYFGSDAKRSPLDRARDPGDPEYKPEEEGKKN
eukprot:CAMPEP_0170174240 /NCGR_PEP_ID=MMETSP0040_2-20121228/7480_1 /TAXON_ID=641309 /ORGANISM="Lotharella oceanica, Strain CCMP622" /LENGTH=286 /DNA_ID=CAMNT_0010415791 /DNA_START=83 /DNA_END=943 /DNA_ORIENTATION=-